MQIMDFVLVGTSFELIIVGQKNFDHFWSGFLPLLVAMSMPQAH